MLFTWYSIPQMQITKDIIISKGSVSVHETFRRLKENIVKEAAMILCEIMTQYIQNDDNLPWSRVYKKDSPELLRLFLKTLISPEDSHH